MRWGRKQVGPKAHWPHRASRSLAVMCQCLRPHTRHWARAKKNQKKLGPSSGCRPCDVFGLDLCLGGNSPTQRWVLMACKSGAAIPLWCAAGIGARANPECFVIPLSSNPISISGHSINRIKIWLKVIIRPASPRGTSPACADPAIAPQPRATLLASPQGFHHGRDFWGWPELQTGQPVFSITTEK